MGRIVYQQIDLVIASDATQDIWSVVGTATTRIKLLGWELSSNATAAAIIDVSLQRVTASGSGGAVSSTEELADEDVGASVAVIHTEDTTPGTPGGTLMSYQWEQLGPIGHVFTPEMAPVSLVSTGFALVMNTAATPTVSGYICWEEL